MTFNYHIISLQSPHQETHHCDELNNFYDYHILYTEKASNCEFQQFMDQSFVARHNFILSKKTAFI